MFKYNYSKIDPILKKNPNINWDELKKKHPEIKISKWSLLSRKALLQGRPGYGRKNRKIPKLQEVREKSSNIEGIVKELCPNTSNFKDEYKRIAEILIKNPSTTYKTMKLITMSFSNFYDFRRKFIKRMGLNGQRKNSDTEIITRSRKKNTLYQIIFEKEIEKNFNPKSLELLQDFINILNQERIMNAEIFEIINPKHIIEIRSYSK